MHHRRRPLGANALLALLGSACDSSGPTEPAVPETVLYADIALGTEYSCGLARTGAVYCWGTNAAAQLGTIAPLESCGGISPFPCARRPVPVATNVAFRSLDAGGATTCGLDGDGRAYCWGWGGFGQLGDGSEAVSAPTPVAVAGGLTFRTLSVGERHVCGISVGGKAYCWGANASGRLGIGSAGSDEDRKTPVAVATDLAFTAIAAGADFTCAVATDGVTYCWGANYDGQLGTGGMGPEPCDLFGAAVSCSKVPVRIGGRVPLMEVAAGNYGCGLARDRRAFCWGGNNSSGRLGVGAVTVGTETPQPVAGDRTFRSISTGADYSCAVAADGAAYCWGTQFFGRLGNGLNPQAASVPAAVAGTLRLVMVRTGRDHACGLTLSGEAYCWGGGFYGQLGVGAPPESCGGPTTECSAVPRRVAEPAQMRR